jgi:hypothetical protein
MIEDPDPDSEHVFFFYCKVFQFLVIQSLVLDPELVICQDSHLFKMLDPDPH